MIKKPVKMTFYSVKLSRRNFIKNSGIAAISLGTIPIILNRKGRKQTSVNHDRPNVLFIMTDQQRFDSLHCNGNDDAITPHTDTLAREGVNFDRAYAAQPVCSPARSSIMSGLFPHKTEVWDNNVTMTDHSLSFPKILHDADYTTGYIGKWHLGPAPDQKSRKTARQVKPLPDYIDLWQGYDSSESHWVDEPRNRWVVRYENQNEIPDFSDAEPGIYRSDQETDQAIDFIRKNHTRPFCLFLSYYPPHTPWTAPPENCSRFKGKVKYPVYYAMVNRIDENIGRLIKAVDDLGIRKKTIIVFTSDHGHHFIYRWNDQPKRNCYDAASRIPLIFNWKGTIPAGRRTQFVSHIDISPTILDLCGISNTESIHGQSMKELLYNPNTGWHDSLYIQNHPFRQDATHAADERWAAMIERCVVMDNWKLILNSHRIPEFYDLSKDPEERVNLWENDGLNHVKKMLFNRLEAWARQTNDGVALSRWLLYKWKI